MDVDKPKPQLYRSRKNRMIAGIAGGLSEFFDLDLSLVRFLWVLAFFLGGGGFLAYIIAWVIIPEEPEYSAQTAHTFSTEDRRKTLVLPRETEDKHLEEENTYYGLMDKRRRTAGFVLIGIGALFLFNQNLPFHLIHRFWPLILIGLGVFILVRNKKGE